MDRKDWDGTEQEARRLYRRAVEEVDTAARGRLAAARERALSKGSAPALPGWVMPATVAAGAAAVGLAVIINLRGPADYPAVVLEQSASEDMEVIMSADSFDMLSNLDFYLWLTMEPDEG